jgi:hypothetical protein
LGELQTKPRAHWRLSVAKIEKLVSNYLIDDRRQFARGLRAFALQLPFTAVELIDDALENPDEYDVLAPCMLQMIEPKQHFACVQAVSPTDVFLA